MDDSFKDKRFTDNIKVELIFERMSDKPQKKKDVKVGESSLGERLKGVSSLLDIYISDPMLIRFLK